MSAPRFKSLHFADDAIARNFRSVQEATDYLLDAPDAQGVIFTNQELVYGVDNLLYHGLGKLPQGWSLHGQSAPAIIWEDTAQRSDKLIVLRTTMDVVAGVKVY
jgi:hypothetical protein